MPRASARRFPDRTALRSRVARWSFAELDTAVDMTAAALADLDVRGRRIALLLPNLPVFTFAFFGVLRAGGTPLLLNPLSSPRELREAIDDAGAATLLTVEPLLHLVPPRMRVLLADALPERLRAGQEPAAHDIAPGSSERPAQAATARADDEAVLVYTSANDGWSRGARLSDRNLLANLRATIEAMRLEPEDRVAAVLPLAHLFGLTVTHNAPLAAGACVYAVERFSPARLLALLQQERITVLCGVPAIYIALLSAVERSGSPDHALRVAICGGAPLARRTTTRWEERFGIPLRQGYGLTEAAPVCLFNRVDRPNQPGTLGYPFPGVDVEIRAPDGAALAPGEVGEICVRGENVFLGYAGAAGRDPRDFHGEFLRSGDLGSLEPGGSVRFRGVLKPMFTRNGFNVYPRELQRVLEADPRIRRARVAAQPDPTRENEIVVRVEPARGQVLSRDEVRRLCEVELAPYKQPARVEVGPLDG